MDEPADMDPERVVGVDFSAAKADAGRRTWLAEATVADDGLELDALADAATHLDCPPSRDVTLDALVEYLTGDRGSRVVGLDFPFSLPEGFLGGDDWRTFVGHTPDRWGRLDADSPRDLYDEAKARAATEGYAPERTTDAARGAQPPTGFRVRTQTFYGVSGVLSRVVDDVAVAPMDDTDGADTVLVEAYPAALFDDLGGHRTGYKRDTREAISAREANVARLRREGVDFAGHDRFAVATDDALDAVAAAVAAWRAARNDFDTDGGDYAVEGYIYV